MSGVKVDFRPEYLETGLISLKIVPAEVSSIAGTLSVNGYPIIDTREVRTNVQLKSGESLVLAGSPGGHIKNMSKIPLIGDIPILGALFRSTQNDIEGEGTGVLHHPSAGHVPRLPATSRYCRPTS